MKFNYDLLSDTEKITFALRALYQEAGYTRYRMSKFEEYDFYSRNKDYLGSDRVLTFTDTNGRLMALKPDVTLSIIKNGKDMPGQVQKVCYNENVYRVARGTNTFREIMQTGLECIGEVDHDRIREVLSLAAQSLAVCNDRYVLELSQLDILAAVVDEVSLDEMIREKILQCVEEKNSHGISQILKEYGIAEEKANSLKILMSLHGMPGQVLPILKELVPESSAFAVDALEEAVSIFEGTPMEDKIRIDFSLVGNMQYYNGVIFQGFIDGIPGSVLSGGQYDKLMQKMGRKAKAIGFAVYLDMLERLSSMIKE